MSDQRKIATDRQLVLFAIAELALSRPGLDASLGRFADSIDGRDVYEQLKQLLEPGAAINTHLFAIGPKTLQEDAELIEWVLNMERRGAGGFLITLGEAALRADHENYPLMRPLLLRLKKKYPQYD